MFIEINRNDPYSILDAGKVADIVLLSMSCKNTNINGVK